VKAIGTPFSIASMTLSLNPSINRAFIKTIFPFVPTPMLTNDGDALATTGRITIKSITAIMGINFKYFKLIIFKVIVCFN
jgi:hypothetical protein